VQGASGRAAGGIANDALVGIFSAGHH